MKSGKKEVARRLDEIANRVKLISALANPLEADADIDNLVCEVLTLCDGGEPDPTSLQRTVRTLKRVVAGGGSDHYGTEATQYLVARLEADDGG